MKLDVNWRLILRRAWSVRLMALAVVLSTLEVVLPLFADTFRVGAFAALTALVTAAAIVARVLAQSEL